MGRKIALIIVLLAAFGAGAFLTHSLTQRAALLSPNGNGAAQTVQTNTPIPITLKTDTKAISDPGAIATAAARIEPSVVTINTEYRPQMRYGMEDMSGYGQEPQSVPLGTGSGVIISADGVIVTNNHVVQNATKINVTLQDGRDLVGRVLGADAQSDLAVVKVDEKNLPAATLADSDKLRVGEWVVAVGDPLRVGTTVTAGIVSAIRKNEQTGAGTSYASLIQTDAAINPGNSGGALSDIEGRLIGINSAIRSNTGGSVGIGYAIPVNIMRDVVQQLLSKGHVARPWLGIAFGTITDRARQELNLGNAPNGVIVGRIQAGSPGDAAGLQVGDIITGIDGKPLTRAEELQALIPTLKVGDKMQISVWRNGSPQNLTANLTERPQNL